VATVCSLSHVIGQLAEWLGWLGSRGGPKSTNTPLGFATVDTLLISTAYFVQFALIAPHLASGRMDQLEPFRFVPFDSFLYAVDILGYSFMSLATLFGARALSGSKEERLARGS
jgi:hypothetical protein